MDREGIQFPVSEYYEKNLEKDPEAVFIDVHSEEQERYFSCGEAVLVDVMKTLGMEVDQKDLIAEAEVILKEYIPEDSKLTLEDLGTPPEVMKKILENHGVAYVEKESVPEATPENAKEAEEYLDQKLRDGYVVITAVQTIPNYKEPRVLEDDGHYLVVCGSMHIGERKYYVTVDPMFHYYQRGSNEDWVYGMHRGDDIDETTPKTEAEIEPDIVETRDLPYTEEELKQFDIDPQKYGLRVIEAKNFIRNWKDVEGFGKPYNHYGIAVKVQ